METFGQIGAGEAPRLRLVFGDFRLLLVGLGLRILYEARLVDLSLLKVKVG